MRKISQRETEGSQVCLVPGHYFSLGEDEAGDRVWYCASGRAEQRKPGEGVNSSPRLSLMPQEDSGKQPTCQSWSWHGPGVLYSTPATGWWVPWGGGGKGRHQCPRATLRTSQPLAAEPPEAGGLSLRPSKRDGSESGQSTSNTRHGWQLHWKRSTQIARTLAFLSKRPSSCPICVAGWRTLGVGYAVLDKTSPPTQWHRPPIQAKWDSWLLLNRDSVAARSQGAEKSQRNQQGQPLRAHVSL